MVLACGRTHLDRAHWQTMSAADKVLYVRSLQGHEKAREAKGGNARQWPLPPEQYVARIDAAYVSGDTRAVDEVFEGMGK